MSLVTEQHSMRNPRVLHWYDFLCPFCYIGQSRNAVLVQHGFNLAELTFQIHPEIPHGGISVGPRKGPMYTMLEREAKEAGLPLHWPRHLPNSLSALAAVFAATAVAVSQTGPRTGPVFTKDGDLVLPTGFREWIRIGSRLRGIGRSCPQLVARTEEAFRFDSTLEVIDVTMRRTSASPAWEPVLEGLRRPAIQGHPYARELLSWIGLPGWARPDLTPRRLLGLHQPVEQLCDARPHTHATTGLAVKYASATAVKTPYPSCRMWMIRRFRAHAERSRSCPDGHSGEVIGELLLQSKIVEAGFVCTSSCDRGRWIRRAVRDACAGRRPSERGANR